MDWIGSAKCLTPVQRKDRSSVPTDNPVKLSVDPAVTESFLSASEDILGLPVVIFAWAEGQLQPFQRELGQGTDRM